VLIAETRMVFHVGRRFAPLHFDIGRGVCDCDDVNRLWSFSWIVPPAAPSARSYEVGKAAIPHRYDPIEILSGPLSSMEAYRHVLREYADHQRGFPMWKNGHIISDFAGSFLQFILRKCQSAMNRRKPPRESPPPCCSLKASAGIGSFSVDIFSCRITLLAATQDRLKQRYKLCGNGSMSVVQFTPFDRVVCDTQLLCVIRLLQKSYYKEDDSHA